MPPEQGVLPDRSGAWCPLTTASESSKGDPCAVQVPPKGHQCRVLQRHASAESSKGTLVQARASRQHEKWGAYC
eukprot:scaffold256248_cov24-Tisochrysis_lutea.AAC.1